jgi:AcrR family transcriptional regulator
MDGGAKTDTRSATFRPTREAILAAACRAIIRRGVDGTRIADIAREAGTSTGTVHYYFDTKEDALTAALRWAHEQMYVNVDEVLGIGADPVSRLAALLESSVPYPGPAREEWVVFLGLWSRLLHRPDLIPEGESVELRWRSYFVEAVRSGTANGAFRPIASPDEVAERLVALVDGLGLKAVVGRPPTTPEHMRDVLLRFAAEQLGVGYEELERRARAVRYPPAGRVTASGGSRPSSTARTESTGRV